MRVLELADKVRQRVKESGLPIQVIEVAGWQTRGYEFPVRPDGALRHWTATGGTGRTTTLGAVTNGRTSPTPLTGPLCELYQSRNLAGYDDIYIVASGKANHAGEGEWNGIKPGNYQVLGLEIEWAGPTESFPAKRKLVSEIAMRALMDCVSGTNDNDACEHREWALPRGRKIDTNLSGDELRRRMTELRTGTTPTPVPSPSPTNPGDDDMGTPASFWAFPDRPHVYIVPYGGNTKTWVPNPDSLEWAQALMKLGGFDTTIHVADNAKAQAWLEGLPTMRTVPETSILLKDVAKAVVDALPPATTGTLTAAQIESALKNTLEASGLLTLLPGK